MVGVFLIYEVIAKYILIIPVINKKTTIENGGQNHHKDDKYISIKLISITCTFYLVFTFAEIYTHEFILHAIN